jgi:hypothetical protein
MQGKYDKRASKDALRPEHQCNDYLDALVRTAADFYGPFAKNFINLGYGNHETAIVKAHETDLTQRLAGVLNDRHKTSIQTIGYTGFIRFEFALGKNFSKTLWYTHGSGGGSPVTHGYIANSRQQFYIDADIFAKGHVHRCWAAETIKHGITERGKLNRKSVWYVQCATYKDSYGDGVAGFEVEKGLGPRPLGAWWMRFYYEKKHGVLVEFIKAG